MKKIIYTLLISCLISSCSTEIEYRIPAFQATINGSNNWEATNFSVTTNALGEGIITGNNFNEGVIEKIKFQGNVEYILKPFDANFLYKIVDILIRTSTT